MEQNLKISSEDGKLLSKPESYRRLVGRLIYLTITRPNINFAFHILSQYMHQPREPHLSVAHRFLRYLKGTTNQGFILSSKNSFQISAYCDSDWASCPITRRSTTMSRSSAEAEYRSMATTACELIWLKTLFSDLGIHHPQPMHLHCDNQASLHMAANPVYHERTKHIEIDCHIIREKIQAGLISTFTKHQLAGILTKASGKEQFIFLLSKLGVLLSHILA
ncbi:hypothetical protein AMTRI_Chr06g196210 [Amborella trichopoda]